MQFMVIRDRAAADAGASLDDMLREGGGLRLSVDLRPGAEGARLALSPGGVAVERGPFADELGVAGFSVFEAASKDAAIEQLRRWADAQASAHAPLPDGATLELRETGCPGGCPTVLAPDAPEAGQRWVILLRSDAMTESDAVPPQAALDTLNAFNARAAQAGVLLAGDGLKAAARGARVRAGGGHAAVIDGPFTEAKELIAGFWMFQAASLADAIAWASNVPYPTGPHVRVELRQVAPAAITPAQRHADDALRAEQLDAALRATLAPAPAWR